MVTQRVDHKWGMVVDLDRCTGCQACVVACQSENNLPINTKDLFLQRRAYEWIRIERYWEGEFPDVKARFLPVLCQHCDNAPCEPVCPVDAIFPEDQVPADQQEFIKLNYEYDYDSSEPGQNVI